MESITFVRPMQTLSIPTPPFHRDDSNYIHRYYKSSEGSDSSNDGTSDGNNGTKCFTGGGIRHDQLNNSSPTCTTFSETTLRSVSIASSYDIRTTAADHSCLLSSVSSVGPDDEGVLYNQYAWYSGKEETAVEPNPIVEPWETPVLRGPEPENCPEEWQRVVGGASLATSNRVALASLPSIEHSHVSSTEFPKVPDVISYYNVVNGNGDSDKVLKYTSLCDLMRGEDNEEGRCSTNVVEEYFPIIPGGSIGNGNDCDDSRRMGRGVDSPLRQIDDDADSCGYALGHQVCSEMVGPNIGDLTTSQIDLTSDCDLSTGRHSLHSRMSIERTTLHSALDLPTGEEKEMVESLPIENDDFHKKTIVSVPADDTLLGSELGLLKLEDVDLDLCLKRSDRRSQCACVVM